MAIVKFNTMQDVEFNELQSNWIFDRFEGIKEKPSVGAEGYHKKTSDLVVAKYDSNRCNYTPIISDSPNLCKQLGDHMSENGFLKLPRSLLNNPIWKSMRLKYRHVFITLLNHTSFRKQSYGIGANSITIEPGQFCTSMRNLMDLCNEGIRFKEDKVDKNIVERAVSLLKKAGFVRQEVIYGKSILTITYSEIYDHFKKHGLGLDETNVRLNRDLNEEGREREYIETNERGGQFDSIDSSLSDLEKEDLRKELDKVSVSNQKTKTAETEEFDKDVELMMEYARKHKMCQGWTKNNIPGIKEEDVKQWIKKYGKSDVFDCLKIVSITLVSKSYPGYVTKLLKEGVAERENKKSEGKKYVEELVNQNKMNNIRILEHYCIDLNNNKEISYNLPRRTIYDFMNQSFQNNQNFQRRHV